MQNEYLTSLNLYQSFEHIYKRFLEERRLQRTPAEEEYLAFLLEVRKYWPIMFAVDQRTELRHMLGVVRNLVNIDYRWPLKRQSIQASKRHATQLLEDALDDKAHQDRPWYDLKELEAMAKAVELYTPKDR